MAIPLIAENKIFAAEGVKTMNIKKSLALLLMAPLMLASLSIGSTAAEPSMSISATEFTEGDEIVFEYSGTSSLDWIGIYSAGTTPGTVSSTLWAYSYDPSEGTISLPADMDGGTASSLEPGNYTAYLCKNDGYEVLAQVDFTVNAVIEPEISELIMPVEVEYSRVYPDTASAEGTITVTPGEGASEFQRYIAYFGNESGILEGYSEAAYFDAGVLEKNIAACTVLPTGTTRLYLYPCTLDTVGKDCLSIEISGAGESSEKPLRSFWVVTDMHVCTTDSESAYTWNGGTYYYNENVKSMYKDISALTNAAIAAGDNSCVGIFTVGDNTNHGYETEWQRAVELSDEFLTADLPVYYTLGNHESYYSDYKTMVDLFMEYGGSPAAYYYNVIDGMYFIHLGSDKQSDSASIGSDEQTWLRALLDEAAEAGAPAYVFLHQPLLDTVSGSLNALAGQSWGGHIVQNAALTELFSEYPGAVLFSGHTHWKFDSLVPVVNGGGKGASFVNCASVGYLWNDDDKVDGGSQGLFVEVYSDHITLRAREFADGEWLAYAQFELPLEAEYSYADASVETIVEETEEAAESVSAAESALETSAETEAANTSKSNSHLPAILIGAGCAVAVVAAAVIITVIRKKKK